MNDWRNWLFAAVCLLLIAAYGAVCVDYARRGYSPVIDTNGGVHWEKER